MHGLLLLLWTGYTFIVMPPPPPESATSCYPPSSLLRLIPTAADIALMIDRCGLVRAVTVASTVLLREIGDRQEWLGKEWQQTVTVQSYLVAESLLTAQSTGSSRFLRHVDHVVSSRYTIPVVYTPLPLWDDGEDGGTLLMGRDLRAMDFTNVVLRAEPEAASAYVKALATQGVDPETICLDVLAPTARRLGILWREDACSFAEVTLGLGSLHQIVRELVPPPIERESGIDHGRRILVALAPGEQHSFGLSIVRRFFLGAGWDVSGGASLSVAEATKLVRQEDFDVVGLSAASENRFSELTAAIRRLRAASRNRSIRVMVGGQVFAENPGLVAIVGADMTARDGRHAVLQAEHPFNRSVAK